MTNRREPNSPRLIGRLKPAPRQSEAMQTLATTPFCPLTKLQPYQRDGDKLRREGERVARRESVLIISGVDRKASRRQLMCLV